MEALDPAQQQSGVGVSTLVDHGMLARLQDAVARFAQLSVTVFDIDGAVFTQSLLSRHDLHAAVISSSATIHNLLQSAGRSTDNTLLRIPLQAGASMLVFPLRL